MGGGVAGSQGGGKPDDSSPCHPATTSEASHHRATVSAANTHPRYLNPDVLIDSTSCRWKMKKSSIVGMATTTEAAMM
jgi:hypothetical protein